MAHKIVHAKTRMGIPGSISLLRNPLSNNLVIRPFNIHSWIYMGTTKKIGNKNTFSFHVGNSINALNKAGIVSNKTKDRPNKATICRLLPSAF